MFSKFTAFVGAIFLTGSSGQMLFSPGIKSGIDINVLSQAKDAYFNVVMNKLNSIKIPDIEMSDGSGYLRDNHFVYESTADNVLFYTDIPNNALVLKCKKVTAVFYSNDFYYKAAPLVVAKGTLEVDLNTIMF